jgi:hypothetical protein
MDSLRSGSYLLLVNPLVALEEATGLRLGFANTMLFMQPMGGQSSEYGAAYDLDVISSWTLIGRGTGRLVGVSIRPTDLFYVTAGASNAYSQTIRAEIDSLFSRWNIFAFGEVGFTPTFKALGEGRYSVGLWHMDARANLGLPEHYGMTVILDQNPHGSSFFLLYSK